VKAMNKKTVLTRSVMALALLALGAAAGYQLANRKQPAAGVAASAGDADRKVLYWYDPMVPTQRFDRPGKSPFMEMQLVPRYADEAGADTGSAVAVSPQAVQSLGLRAGEPADPHRTDQRVRDRAGFGDAAAHTAIHDDVDRHHDTDEQHDRNQPLHVNLLVAWAELPG